MTTHENNGIQGAISKKGEANFGFAFFIFSDRKERQHSAIENSPSLQSFTTCEAPGPNLSIF